MIDQLLILESNMIPPQIPPHQWCLMLPQRTWRREYYSDAHYMITGVQAAEYELMGISMCITTVKITLSMEYFHEPDYLVASYLILQFLMMKQYSAQGNLSYE